jgi:hypothetical protein
MRVWRGAAQAVDAMGESLKLPGAGQPGDSLRADSGTTGLSSRDHAPLASGYVSELDYL